MRHKLYDRIGTFVIKKSDMDALPDWLQILMARVIILKAGYSYSEDGFEYAALSPDFEPNPDNQIPTRYQPVVEEGRFLRWAR